PPSPPPCPYTTLFRSLTQRVKRGVEARGLPGHHLEDARVLHGHAGHRAQFVKRGDVVLREARGPAPAQAKRADDARLAPDRRQRDRKSTRLNSSHQII